MRFSICYVDKFWRKWDISDAKDGDILATYDGKPFFFKGCLDKEHTNCPVAYCGIRSDECLWGCTGDYWWTDKEVKPATKEQRDTLMKAMADVRWEFDFNKKEFRIKHN
jgi:hypothetical protein